MLNIIDIINAAVVVGTTLLFATIGEIIIEKVGNLNLAVEGMILIGAFAAFISYYYTSSLSFAIISCLVAGALIGLIYCIITITLKANQVVTGLSLTFVITGFCSVFAKGIVAR